MPSELRTGDLSTQMEWHEVYRDAQKNMYRTSYTDMSRGREVSVKRDYPSGYGGHIPCVRHDILFRNTGFDRVLTVRQNDKRRDAFPSFADQLEGFPVTKAPRGAKRPPTYGVIPHDGTTTMLKPPWGMFPNRQNPPLTFRAPPPSMSLILSARPSTVPARTNEAALSAGNASLNGRPSSAQKPSTKEVFEDTLKP